MHSGDSHRDGEDQGVMLQCVEGQCRDCLCDRIGADDSSNFSCEPAIKPTGRAVRSGEMANADQLHNASQTQYEGHDCPNNCAEPSVPPIPPDHRRRPTAVESHPEGISCPSSSKLTLVD